MRVIAGDYDGHRGPARTFTPINVWDLRLRQDGQARLAVPDGHTAAVVVLRGTVQVNGSDVLRDCADGAARPRRRGTDDRGQ